MGDLDMSYRAPGFALWATLLSLGIMLPFGHAAGQSSQAKGKSAQLIETGQGIFLQNCAFCHGRDAGGGETGPDLTGSKLVASDVGGNKIGDVVRNGRVEKGMPRFGLPDSDITAIAAFIHDRKAWADAHPGGRRRVDPEDLQTGNAEAGKAFFNGAGGCSGCHSPEGDLAGVASRYKGLKLEERLLYPTKAPAKLTVTLPSGETVTGTLAYRDEFTVGLTDASGWYRSWPVSEIKYKVDAPAEAHAELLAKYTDDDIHNLMAYLQRLHHETASK
jgi:cytochrome c oxidase cbb3-type subunit III